MGHITLYRFGMYMDQPLLEWFEKAYATQLNHILGTGNICVRFKKPEKTSFGLIAELMRRRTAEDWISCYENVRPRE